MVNGNGDIALQASAASSWRDAFGLKDLTVELGAAYSKTGDGQNMMFCGALSFDASPDDQKPPPKISQKRTQLCCVSAVLPWKSPDDLTLCVLVSLARTSHAEQRYLAYVLRWVRARPGYHG